MTVSEGHISSDGLGIRTCAAYRCLLCLQKNVEDKAGSRLAPCQTFSREFKTLLFTHKGLIVAPKVSKSRIGGRASSY